MWDSVGHLGLIRLGSVSFLDHGRIVAMLGHLSPTQLGLKGRWPTGAGHVLGLCVPQWFGAGDLEQDARDAVARGFGCQSWGRTC